MSVTESSTEPSAPPTRATVEISRPTVRAMLRETWAWRALIPRLGVRVTIKGISGTYLGRGWLFLRPALTIFGMAFLFGRVLNAPSQGLPYLLFLLIGMHAWLGFQRSAFWVVRSFDVYRRVIRNMYMPLLVVPLSAAVPAFVEFCIIGMFALGALVYFTAADGQLYLEVGPTMLVALAGYFLAYLCAISVGMWVSVLNAYARDVRMVFVFLLRIWMFITPVIYPLTTLSGVLKTLAELNPVAAPVLMVKWGLLGVGEVPLHSILITFGWVLVVGTSGLWFLTNRAPTVLSHQPPGMDDEDEYA